MDFKIRYDTANKWFVIKTQGQYTTQDHNRMFSQLGSHPDWKKGLRLLIDHRQTTIHHTTLNDVDEAINTIVIFKEKYGLGACASVLQIDGYSHAVFVAYGINVRMGMDFRVFPIDEYEKAVSWLKLEK